jgi:hypothetical protein
MDMNSQFSEKKRHEEYIEYYKVKMLKYEDNPIYKNSYNSEKSLYDAISSSTDIDEFGRKIEKENLAVKNAIALIKDHETARKKLYMEIKEDIRLHAPLRILDTIDSMKNDMDIVNKVSEIENQVSKEISIDLFTTQFSDDLDILEEIEVYKNAQVPDEWKKKINQEIPNEMIRGGHDDWHSHVIPQAQTLKPDWEFEFDLLWDNRHRRLLPFSDEILKKRIQQFKDYRGI